jgi:hypothetical protein
MVFVPIFAPMRVRETACVPAEATTLGENLQEMAEVWMHPHRCRMMR